MDEKTWLLARAARYRQMAQDIMDMRAEHALLALAEEYEQRAAALREGDATPAAGDDAAIGIAAALSGRP